MADQTTTQLAAISALDEDDLLLVVEDGTAKKVTVAQLRTALGVSPGWTTITKAGDESVSSNTTPQNDDDFFFTTVSGALYEIVVSMMYGSPAGGTTPDLKVSFGEDATARGTAVSLGFSNTDASVHVAVLCDQTATLILGTATADRPARFDITYVGGGGTFRMLWAQNTSGSNASIVRAGSVMRYRRIV